MVSRFFKIHELVAPQTFKERGERAWELLDSRLIVELDILKEHFSLGTMTINNYHWGGDRVSSGRRIYGQEFYNEYSQHADGRAVDIIFSNYTALNVRLFIIDNPHLFKYITAIEMGVSWLHIDVRNVDDLKLFYP